MSTDQPTPGPGEPPEEDPLRKRPPDNGGGAEGDAPGGGEPPPPGGGPYGGPYGPPPPGSPYGGPPGGGGPYNGSPYGGEPHAADPLAGMPPLANRGKRLVARIIDGLLIGIPVGALMTFALGGYDPTDVGTTGKSFAVQGVVVLVYLVYEGLMLTHYGQTVGKKLMNIRVAMLDNGTIPAGSPGWMRAAVYSVPELLGFCGTIFWLINVLWCTGDRPYRQCLHDKAAKTVVVEVR